MARMGHVVWRSAMIHRDDAVRINSEVREFYKSGKKSGNKIYVNNVPSNQYISGMAGWL